MTILIVADVWGEENNGTVIAAKNLRRGMIARGHRVKVLCPGPILESEKGDPDIFLCPNLKLPKFLDDYVKENGVSLGTPTKAVVAKAFEDVDVVHIMMPLFIGSKVCKFARKAGLPITAGFHCQAENVSNHFGMMNVGWVNSLIYRNFYDSLYQWCKGIHYPTAFIRNLYERSIHRGTPGYVISNGVQSRFLNAPKRERPAELKGKYVIVFSGRISKEKNQALLVKAVKLCRHEKDIQLILAGEGPEAKKIERLGRSLTNAPILKFYPHEELVKILKDSDLYVHPALIDLESISALEAISCGLLPLLTDSPRAAVSEYSRDPHCLFHYDDPKDLAQKIDWFIDHPQEAETIREKYKGFGDNYDIDACMDKMEAMFKAVLAESKAK